MYVDKLGTRIHAEIGGRPDGSPLSPLRGLMRTIGHWGGLLADLESTFRTIVIDHGVDNAAIHDIVVRAESISVAGQRRLTA